MIQPYTDIEQCVDRIIEKVGRRLVVGTPLGLGKANLLLNAIYQRALSNPELEVVIFTALTLEVPRPKQELEKRFMQPLLERWFNGYPDLDYAVARSNGQLPQNVTVHEFFMSPGKFLRNSQAQQDYISTNYTHVARDMLSRGVNVVVQMVSPGVEHKKGRVSLSCNPDVTLELIPKMRASGRKVIAVGEVNEKLPYLYGDADVPESFFDELYTPPPYTLFGAPKASVSLTDHLIGLHASSLVRDDGTLQVGIGSLGDAVANALGLRHTDNATYVALLKSISSPQTVEVQKRLGAVDVFRKGLYGATEMFVDGFLYLFKLGILTRRVYDDVHVQELINTQTISERVDAHTLDELERHHAFEYPLTERGARYLQDVGVLSSAVEINTASVISGDEKLALPSVREEARDFLISHALGTSLCNPSVLHGGFYLGDQAFYQALRELTEEERKLLKMTSVDRINQLYRGEALDRVQRRNARFINTCLMVTLNGAVVSDGLDNNRVLSGVGGQYNFVAMAHALDDSRSVIKLRSTYSSSSGLRSNIVFNYAHCTIPRHLRDVVVTEYGCADLRGRSEAECAAALINIADSRFQPELVEQAIKADKLPLGYQVPADYRQNTPERVEAQVGEYRATVLPPFPLGTDLTEEDIKLGGALKQLAAATSTPAKMAQQVLKSLTAGDGAKHNAMLARLGLNQPKTLKEKLTRRMLINLLNS
ncbi:MAG: acetyl-CoA hydrolase/transferase C-terminal domain-containing protein [Gammaproteobacteria bacterium]